MSTRVLIVDDEPDLLEAMTSRLSKEMPQVVIEPFTDPEAALARLRSSPPDVLVTDLRMHQISGLELLTAARGAVGRLPVIVMSAFGTAELERELQRGESLQFLRKPFKIRALAEAVQRAISAARGFSGAIHLPMLPDVIQLYALARATGALRLSGAGLESAIYFQDGEIIAAECGDARGEEAFYRVLSLSDGAFSMDTMASLKERSITAPWHALLMEGMRRYDESRHNDRLGLARADASEPAAESDDDPMQSVTEMARAEAPGALLALVAVGGGQTRALRGNVSTEAMAAVVVGAQAIARALRPLTGESSAARLSCRAGTLSIELGWRPNGEGLLAADRARNPGDEAVFTWKASRWCEQWFAGSRA